MISRRDVLKFAAVAAAGSARRGLTQDTPERERPAPDYKLEIAPATLELSPDYRVRTDAYNGQAPGPLLRFQENTVVDQLHRGKR